MSTVDASTVDQSSCFEMEKKIDPSIPLASVSRIVKRVLPSNVQVSKDSKQAFARASGVFVLYVTAA